MRKRVRRTYTNGRVGLWLARVLAKLFGFTLTQLRREVNAKYNRFTPTGDYLLDRWNRAKEMGFGSGSSVYDSTLVIGDVEVGRNTWIGPFVVLDGSGGLVIGSNCSISAGVQIYSHDSVNWALSEGEVPIKHAPVTIGDGCYLGPNVVVQKGVSVGEGCVIGANSFIRNSIPARSFAVGNPARVVGPAEKFLGQPQ